MSINNVQTLHDLAETSLVSYANPDSASKGSDRIFSGELINEDRGAGLTDYQAEQFAKKYEFIDQQKNIDYNGFSAMLLVDKVTQKKVLAMRGTEFTQGLPQIVTDGIVADALGIGASGYANLQGLEMYRYWKKLTTAGGQPVSYTDNELLKLYAFKLGPVAGGVVLALPPAAGLAAAGFIAFKQHQGQVLHCNIAA